jgi:hypothetical protein
MPAGGYDMVCEQGATFLRQFTWTDENEVPVNLTGFTARMHIRTTVAAASTTLELTTANGRITLNPSQGTITLQLTATETAALAAKRYVYDLELVSGASVTRLLQGAFTVSPEVTR